MKKIIVKKSIYILFLFIVLVMNANSINADEITNTEKDVEIIGESEEATFLSCGSTGYNGCLGLIGYKITVIQKNYTINSSKETINYNAIASYKPITYRTTKNFATFSNLLKNNRDGILDEILKKIGIDEAVFLKNEYNLLIEGVFDLIFDVEIKAIPPFTTKFRWQVFGLPYKIADGTSGIYNIIYNDIPDSFSESACIKKLTKNPNYKYKNSTNLTGVVTIPQQLPCKLYISGGASEKYCADETYYRCYKKRFLEMVKEKNSIYNKAILKASQLFKGSLKIVKHNSDDKKITNNTSSVTFKYYKKSNSSSNCNAYNNIPTNASTISFTVNNEYKTITGLDPGTYCVYETSAPKGYELSDKTAHKVTVSSGAISTITFKDAKNQTCASEFNALSNKYDMAARINLYNTYGQTNLLNLSITTGSTACENATCSSNVNIGCLSVKEEIGEFSASNLSCYDEIINLSDGSASFCKVTYNLTNNLINEQQYSYKSSIDFGTVKLGQMFLSGNADTVVATGVLHKICYAVGDKTNQTLSDSTSYGSYVSGIKFNDEYFNQVSSSDIKITSSGIPYTSFTQVSSSGTTISSSGTLSITSSGTPYKYIYTEFKKTYSYDYKLPAVYAIRGTGELTPSGAYYNNLGYGFISSFNGFDDNIIPFSITFTDKFGKLGKIVILKNGSKNTFTGTTSFTNSSCTITGKSELLEPDELNLEFRLISKSNPFPGKNGNGRKVGSNWCYFDNCTTTGNNMITKYITNKNDSYNSTGAGAKYVINLNSTSIKYIKETYKDNAYDDFETECDTTKGTCAINFINDLKNKGYLTISNNTSTDDVLYGDVDENGIVNKKDSLYLKEYLERTQTLTEQGKKNADMNADGIIDEKDHELLKNKLAGN